MLFYLPVASTDAPCVSRVLLGPSSCHATLAITVTPLPNGDERKLSVQPQPFPRSRVSSIPINSTHSTASTPPYDPRKSLIEEAKKKKKKRKREDVSDTESGEL